MLSQGNVKWFVQRDAGGRVVWSLSAIVDGKQVIVRGTSRSPSAARAEIGTALVEIVTLRRVPEGALVTSAGSS